MDTPPNASSEQELLQLRDEGKITEVEYQELLATLKRPAPTDGGLRDSSRMGPLSQVEMGKDRNIPPVLWIGLVSLALMVAGKVFFAFSLGPKLLIDAALSAALLVGLYLGHRWAYVLTIVFTALGTIIGLTKGAQHGVAILLGDCLVLIPVILSTDHFFQTPEELRPN